MRVIFDTLLKLHCHCSQFFELAINSYLGLFRGELETRQNLHKIFEVVENTRQVGVELFGRSTGRFVDLIKLIDTCEDALLYERVDRISFVCFVLSLRLGHLWFTIFFNLITIMKLSVAYMVC